MARKKLSEIVFDDVTRLVVTVDEANDRITALRVEGSGITLLFDVHGRMTIAQRDTVDDAVAANAEAS